MHPAVDPIAVSERLQPGVTLGGLYFIFIMCSHCLFTIIISIYLFFKQSYELSKEEEEIFATQRCVDNCLFSNSVNKNAYK